MMNIKIYQVNTERDIHGVCFMGYDRLERLRGTTAVDSSIYDRVFSGEVKCANLEDVWIKFNQRHPKNYKARSLSISDVVEVIDKEGKSEYYFVDTIGFKRIDFEPENTKLSERYTDLSKGEKITVLFVPVGKCPVVMEISNTYEAMIDLIGGEPDEYMPFEDDDIVLVCSQNSKEEKKTMNRAVYVEPKRTEVSYNELTRLFCEAENKGQHLLGHIVFTPDTFKDTLSEFERTYEISSDNKAFKPNMGGYSIYGRSLDGIDPCLRMEGLMADEKGGESGWKIEKCFLVEDTKEVSDIICGDFFIAQSDVADEKYGTLSKEQMVKYQTLFMAPERFEETDNGIKVEVLTTKRAEKER